MSACPVRTSFQSPWQNGVAERWIESCRHDLLDHVIVVNECHLKRLLSDYVRYYHEDRTHLGLNKETPAGRIPSTDRGEVVSRSRLGGLHHRYDRLPNRGRHRNEQADRRVDFVCWIGRTPAVGRNPPKFSGAPSSAVPLADGVTSVSCTTF